MIIVVGPSGSGKDSVVDELVKRSKYKKAVTYTTRPRRSGEVDGLSYHFVTIKDFKDLADSGFFAEHVIYNNNCYGTPMSIVKDNVIGILEPKGIGLLKKNDKDMFSIFVDTSPHVRAIRMSARGDSLDDIKSRIDSDDSLFTEKVKSSCNFIFLNDGKLTDTKIDKLLEIIDSSIQQ